MSEQPSRETVAGQVASELARCRQRGLDDLDRRAHNQEPVQAPELERLAREYCEAKGLAIFGRIAQIRKLLQGALSTYAERGNETESQFISSLFFTTEGTTKKRPGQLLTEAQVSSGLDDERFAEYRRRIFGQFASFLIVFVAEAAQARTSENMPGTITGKRRRRLVVVSTVVTVLVVSAGVLTAVLLTSSGNPGGHPAVGSGGSGQTPPSTPSVGLPPGHKTYTEQEAHLGVKTFQDPFDGSINGPSIQPLQKVQVSCKVYAVPFPTVYPDGYWYRIASKPWNNQFYAPANTFLNGNSIQGTSKEKPIETDRRVPNCPQ